MIQGTEALQLAIAAILGPICVYSVRRIDIPSRRYISAALIALTFSYVFTVLEGFVAYDFFNILEHAMLALSGVMFALSAWVARQYWHSRTGGER